VHSEILDKEETHHHEIADRMTLLENYAQNIETGKIKRGSLENANSYYEV
jgi:hypothetical protein